MRKMLKVVAISPALEIKPTQLNFTEEAEMYVTVGMNLRRSGFFFFF